MELSNELKAYIEENQDLIDTDIVEFAQKYLEQHWKKDRHAFIDILQNVLGELKDLQQVIDDAQSKVLDISHKLTTKYGVAGFSGSINLNVSDKASIESIEKYGINYLGVYIVNDGSVPPSLPSEYTYKLTTEFSLNSKRIQLEKDGVKSAACAFDVNTTYITLKDLYTLNFLKPFEIMFEKSCAQAQESLNGCINSFEWSKVIKEDIAPNLFNKLNDLSNRILGKQIYKITHNDSYTSIYTGYELSKQTKIDFDVTLYYYKDPKSIDVDDILDTAEKKLNKFKTNLERKEIRQREKELERQNNPSSAAHITRREVSAAIRAAGFNPSNTVYTNKYPNITTYKYQFMNLAPHECDKVKDELLKIGADVHSVTTEGSMSGRGPYTSLFVKIRN